MDSTIAVIATVAALAAWRLRIRRNPNWATNDDARFYISAGTWSVLITLYWVLQSDLDDHWVWNMWPILACVSMLLLVRGIDELGDRSQQGPFVPAPDDRRTARELVTAHTAALTPHRPRRP